MTVKSSHAYAERIREASRLAIALVLGIAPTHRSLAEEAADWHRYHVESDVAAAPGLVCSTLSDLEGFRRWFPGLREWRLLDPARRDPEVGPVPVYGRQHGFGPIQDRD